MTVHDHSARGRLSRALEAAAPPQAFLDTLHGEASEVVPGQLWRARRGSRSMLAVICSVDGATVELAPVTIDDGSNERAVDLPAQSSDLQAPLTVWRALVTSVPMRTLEQPIGKLLDLPGGDVLDAIAETGQSGPAAVSAADSSQAVAARLQDTLEELAATPLPGGSGQLRALLKESGLGVGELADVLNVASSVVLELRRGRRAISAEQAHALAPAVGISEDELLAANPTPPEPLVAWMSRPPQRRRVVKLAQAKDLDEDRAFSHATFSCFALAARTAGDTNDESLWAALGERYFESVLDES